MSTVLDNQLTAARISPLQLFEQLNRLTDKEKTILQFLDQFHYTYGSHFQRLFFTNGTPLAMTRARNRCLTALVNRRILYRYPRRPLSGNRHGSTEHIYALAHAGQRIVNELLFTTRPFRSIERTTPHFNHALFVTELYVRLREEERASRLQVITAYGEPSCHRHFASNAILKPDAYFLFHITRDGKRYEVGWFIEVEHTRHNDASTESKIKTYREYRKHLDPDKEFMPRVLFLALTDRHRFTLAKLLARYAGTDRNVFTVALFDNAIATILTLPL